MSLSHFTLKECPDCMQSETAVGDPNTEKWHCFNCQANGTIEYRQNAVPDTETDFTHNV